MLKNLFRKLVHSFWHDELAAKRWVKGTLLALLTVVIQLMVTDAWMEWSVRQWIYHLLPGVIGFVIGSIQKS